MMKKMHDYIHTTLRVGDVGVLGHLCLSTHDIVYILRKKMENEGIGNEDKVWCKKLLPKKYL